MMSSTDIANLMGSQTQAFMGHNSYSQQIGVSAPGGLDAWWKYQSPIPRGGGEISPGVRAPHSPFSYAPQGFGQGYGFGTRAAGATMATGMGLAMTGLGAVFNPATAFMGGVQAAGATSLMGAGMAGLGAAALPAAVLAGAGYYGGQIMHGAQQQQAVQTQLSQFQFLNPASRTGSGFNRDDALAIGNQIRQLANIPEMMTSMEELTKLLPKLKSSGFMYRSRDATEFADRFKQAVTTIRDVSKLLGTTMEEASEFFAQSRSMGFLGRRDQLQNVLSMQFTSAYTGMTMQQTSELAGSGAQLSRQQGGRGRAGAEAAQAIAQRIRRGVATGSIEEDVLQDYSGGLSGEAGIQQAALKAQNALMGFSRSAPGRLVMAALMKRDDQGRVTLDQSLVQRLNRGELSLSDLQKMAGSMSNEDRMTFMHRAGELAPQFAGAVDFGALMNRIVGQYGKDAAGRVIQTYTGEQTGSVDIDFLRGMGQGPGMRERLTSELTRAREMGIRERSPEAIMRRLMTRLSRGAEVQAGQQWGAEKFAEIGKSVDETIDDVVGRYVLTMSKEGATDIARALGSPAGREELRKTLEQAAKYKAGPAGTGAGRSLTQWGAAAGGAGGVLGGVLAGGLVGMATPIPGGTFGGMVAGGIAAGLGGAGIGATMGKVSSWILQQETPEDRMRALISMTGGGVGTTDVLSRRTMRLGVAAGTEESMGEARGIVARYMAEAAPEGFTELSSEKQLEKAKEVIGRRVATALRGNIFHRGVTQNTQDLDANFAEFLERGGGLSEITKDMTQDEAKLLERMSELHRRGSSNPLATLALATLGSDTPGSHGIKLQGLVTRDAADLFTNVQALSQNRRAVIGELTKSMKASGVALIENSAKARDLVERALTNPKVYDRINSILTLHGGNPERVTKLLQQEGFYNIRESDVGAVENLMKRIAQASPDERKSMLDGLSRYGSLQAITNLRILAEEASRMAETVTDKELQEKLKALSPERVMAGIKEGKTDFMGAIAGIQEQIGAATEEAIKLRQASKFDELTEHYKSLGVFGEAVARGSGIAQAVKESGVDLSKASFEEIAKTFGVDKYDLLKIKQGDKETKGRDIRAADIARLRAMQEAGGIMAGVVPGETPPSAGGLDVELLNTLKELRGVISKNTTVIEERIKPINPKTRKDATGEEEAAK